MRIAVVTTSYPTYDGDPAGHFVLAEVAPLERAGHEVRVLHPKPGGAFGWPGAPTRIRERPTRALDALSWTARAAAELAHFAPQRVIAHWCIPCAFPVAGVVPHAALEVVSHGTDVRLLTRLPGRAAIVRTLLRRTTCWRFVSDELRTTLAASLPTDVVRHLLAGSEVAPPALDLPDVREEARAKREGLAGRRLYVCAGRLVPSKRVDKVIDYVATSSDHGTLPTERTLVVLGDGPERAHLERVAKAWQLDIRFLGKTTRREALSWIGAADEVVHASRVEGLSTVVREAESLGVAVTRLT